MPEWKVYYDNGAILSDKDGDIETLPGLGVQAIAVADVLCGRIVWAKNDWYWWEFDQWFGGSESGMWDYLQRPGWSKTLQGRSIPDELFREIHWKAVYDEGLPRKSAWLKSEWRPSWMRGDL